MPGGSTSNPIVIGEPNGGTSQPATFLVSAFGAAEGQYRYVSGDGVDGAVADGTIKLGYSQPTMRRVKRASGGLDPEFYVKVAANKWVGFVSRAAADRYAKLHGGSVLTRDNVLGGDAT